jgi:hypothetical protein
MKTIHSSRKKQSFPSQKTDPFKAPPRKPLILVRPEVSEENRYDILRFSYFPYNAVEIATLIISAV